jgi:uncharacterized damage-inducible protein DinB
MTESQRTPVPRTDGGELDTALAFLGFVRASLLKKTDGLGEADLRRVLVPTGTTLLGLVQHMARGERYWFGHHLAGTEPDRDWEAGDFGMQVAADRDPADVLADYRAAIADSDAVVRAVGDPEALTALPVGEQRQTLRWVLAHVTSETVRHAGHADILRELIDGVTGR